MAQSRPQELDSKYCNMEPGEYEMLTRDVLVPFAKRIEAEVKQVGCDGNNQVSGKSGFSHQIDVSIRTGECLTLIECKCWNNDIPVGRVLEFAARVIDISEQEGNVKGIMVTTKGYQAGAKVVADHFHISLGTVKDPTDFVVRYGDAFLVGVQDALSLRDSFQYALGIVKS
jgi:hypothetical protein